MGSDDLYLTHRSLIDRAIAAVCRRQRLSSIDAEDFAGAVRLHLIEDDYAVLRKFEGRSSIATYLVTVITHRYQDWRNARWGKWRPSAEAKRQGPLAVHLERLVVRDGLTMDAACETLQTNFQVTQPRQALEAMAAGFPARSGRHFVSDDALDEYPAVDTRADAPLQARESEAAAGRATAALRSVLRELAPQERLILRMRFEDDCSIADIARTLHLEQKPLYKRLERLLADVRAGLERAGLTATAAVEVLAQGGFDRQAGDAMGSGEIRGEVRPFTRSGGSPVQTARTP